MLLRIYENSSASNVIVVVDFLSVLISVTGIGCVIKHFIFVYCHLRYLLSGLLAVFVFPFLVRLEPS